MERAGCVTDQEYRVLDDAYRFLRKTEHRLQLLFDLQTHRLPDDAEELRKLALRMGYPPTTDGSPEPRAAFLADYHGKTEPTPASSTICCIKPLSGSPAPPSRNPI